jgi:3-oxoacyl-[acyl-carrier protein] reductase
MVFNDGYSAANRGIALLTETWAKLGAPDVRVNEIMLGFFETRHGEKTRGWDLLSKNNSRIYSIIRSFVEQDGSRMWSKPFCLF